jgi:uncharacterized surface protein with fasciclin (FAS1) repeats
MKKVTNYLWMFMMAATVLFVASCGEDVEDVLGTDGITLTSASRTIENDGVVAAPGQTFRVYVAAGTSEVTATTNGDVSITGSNTVTNDSIAFTVDTEAELGSTAELNFSTTGGETEQLTLTVGYENVVDVITFAPNFDILRNAITGTDGVLSAIADAAPVTVFAPTDAAFNKAGFNTASDIPQNVAAQILSYHVVKGANLSTDLSDGNVPTLEGSDLEITTTGGVAVNGIPVATADIVTEDGSVVHVIETILDPAFSIINSTAVLLGAQGNSANGSFYNALENQVLTLANARDNSETVDFLYYWGETNNHTIARLGDDGAEAVFTATGPDISGFDPQPDTEFGEATGIDAANFDEIVSQKDLDDAIVDDVVINQSSVPNLSEGSVFLVELSADRGGNLGLVKVASIGGPENGNGTITLDVKLLK